MWVRKLKVEAWRAALLSCFFLVVSSVSAKEELDNFRIYQDNENVYWEVSKDVLQREWLLINQVVANDGLFAMQSGDVLGNPQILKLQLLDETTAILISKIDISAQAGSNMVPPPKQPHEIARFDCQKIKGKVIMDITSWITCDTGIVEGGRLNEKTLRILLHDDSQEIVGWRRDKKGRNIQISSRISLLPQNPIRMRYEDKRMGYFRSKLVICTDTTAEEKDAYCISRWRLEPRERDMKKYRKGILVEPKEPIIFYVDPLTPKKWVPYITQAINNWQVAFEQAGFKNAIQAKIVSENDTAWTLESCKGAIIYRLNDQENAFGKRYADPRSGEILHARVEWGHCLVDWLRENYMVQSGPGDSQVFETGVSDEWLGELLSVIVTHEIGHTLGLTHNMGASSCVPVEKLRDNDWITEHGYSASIMDYSRFNYVVQPGDGIDRRNLIPRIGVYDKWAIEWGYRMLPTCKTVEDERDVLTRWLTEKQEEWGCWFGNEMVKDDPRIQSEDVGDDLVKANTYGMKNLKWVLERMKEWKPNADGRYEDFQRIYKRIASFAERGIPLGQYNYYLKQVTTIVGGSYKNVDSQGKEEFVPVEKEYQQRAMRFLNDYVFATPEWLLEPLCEGKVNENPVEFMELVQKGVFAWLIPKIHVLSERNAEGDYSLEDFWHDIDVMVWGDIDKDELPDVYRRSLHQTFLQGLRSFASRGGPSVSKLVKEYLVRLRTRLQEDKGQMSESMQVYKLELIKQLNEMIR